MTSQNQSEDITQLTKHITLKFDFLPVCVCVGLRESGSVRLSVYYHGMSLSMSISMHSANPIAYTIAPLWVLDSLSLFRGQTPTQHQTKLALNSKMETFDSMKGVSFFFTVVKRKEKNSI